MTDLRLWSQQFTEELIDKYKSLPCLWKIKSEHYKNKQVKAMAYQRLVDFCKKRGFSDATRDFVTRKIQSLRGSFRKELRKVREMQKLGKVHTPNLWYFNNLLFTKDQDEESVGRDEESCDKSDEDSCPRVSDDEDDDDLSDDCKPIKSFITVEASQVSAQPSPPLKRKRQQSDYLPPEFLNVTPETSNTKELSEFDLTGMNVSKKLARMDPTQAIYAEALINTVLKRGLLKRLTEDTDICDNLCQKRPDVKEYPCVSNESMAVSNSDDTFNSSLPNAAI